MWMGADDISLACARLTFCFHKLPSQACHVYPMYSIDEVDLVCEERRAISDFVGRRPTACRSNHVDQDGCANVVPPQSDLH